MKTQSQSKRKHTTPPLKHIRERDSLETKAPRSREPAENIDGNDEEEEDDDGRVNAAIEAISVSTKKEQRAR